MQRQNDGSTANILEKEKIPAGKKRLIRIVKGAAGIKSKASPLFPENGLSIVERYFHHMPDTSPQVVLTYGGRIQMPPKATFLSVERILDVNKRTAAKVFRCASVVDYETQTFVPMGETAADIKIPHKFTELVDETTHRKVQQQEVNQRYDVKSNEYPLWSIHIVGPKEMEEGICVNADIPGTVEMKEFPSFYVFWTFHHCIADGLSGWAFIRLFMSEMSHDNFQRDPIRLEQFPITKMPPPLLDNFIDPPLIDLVPAIVSMASQQIKKGKQKKDQLKQYVEEVPRPQSPVIPEPKSGSTTVVKLLTMTEQDTDLIRDQCRKNKTTIASAVIVASLAAVRVVFAPRAERKQKKLPDHQAWVVTSSTRHLLPNSKLLQGGDKQTDPSLMEFGGYGGSISHERFKFKDTSDLWDRCRSVKKHLSSAFLPSLRRMKLMNYVFRKPSLWKKLQGKVKVEEMTRTYSVEVANLGAWDSVYAPMDRLPDGLATADWFAGTLNNSFVGCRALFTIALISINNIMSFSVAYDSGTITEEEGDLFIKALEQAMNQLKTSSGSQCLVKTFEETLRK